jgi:hypothetical protein
MWVADIEKAILDTAKRFSLALQNYTVAPFVDTTWEKMYEIILWVSYNNSFNIFRSYGSAFLSRMI